MKSTYDAVVSSPDIYQIKMSANQTDDRVVDGQRYASFRSDIPIPGYLIAIVAGDLVSVAVGPRTNVTSEPGFIKESAEALENLEYSLILAETYTTPYIWGLYNIVIMPPSFPFGGMENPLLTFASPSIITPDKSRIGVADHEIGHSWTGNMVTNENWDCF